jgi:hypothetical protein
MSWELGENLNIHQLNSSCNKVHMVQKEARGKKNRASFSRYRVARGC